MELQGDAEFGLSSFSGRIRDSDYYSTPGLKATPLLKKQRADFEARTKYPRYHPPAKDSSVWRALRSGFKPVHGTQLAVYKPPLKFDYNTIPSGRYRPNMPLYPNQANILAKYYGPPWDHRKQLNRMYNYGRSKRLGMRMAARMANRRRKRPMGGNRVVDYGQAKGRAIHVQNPQHGLAPRVFVKCSRTVNMSLAQTAAFLNPVHIRGNSLIDTFLTHSTGSLYGVSAYTGLYQYYKVHASKADVRVINQSVLAPNQGLMVFLRPERQTPVASTKPASQEECWGYPLTKHMYNPGNGGAVNVGADTRISFYIKTKRVFQVVDIDPSEYSASTGNEPSALWNWEMYTTSIDNATVTGTARVIFKLTYWVEFFHREEQLAGDF